MLVINEFETALVIGHDVSIVPHIEGDNVGKPLVVLSAAEARKVAEAILNALPAEDDEDAHYDDIAFGMESAASDALDRW